VTPLTLCSAHEATHFFKRSSTIAIDLPDRFAAGCSTDFVEPLTESLTQKPTNDYQQLRPAFETDNGRSALAAGTGLHAPLAHLIHDADGLRLEISVKPLI
jgi:hypothetical protein